MKIQFLVLKQYFWRVVVVLLFSVLGIIAEASPGVIQAPSDIALTPPVVIEPVKVKPPDFTSVYTSTSTEDMEPIRPLTRPVILSLKDAIFLALRNNPFVENAELDRVTQKYALVAAKN